MRISSGMASHRLTTVLFSLLLAQMGVRAQSITHSDLWEGLDRDRAAKVAADTLRELETAPSSEAAERVWLANADRLRRDGGLAVESLGRFLDSEDPSQRSASVWLLDRIGGAVAAPTLLRAAANHPEPSIRLEALRSLVERNGFVSVAGVLLEAMREQTDPHITSYAKASLAVAFPEPPPATGRAPASLPSRRGGGQDSDEESRRVRAIVEEAMESSTLRIGGEVFAVSRAHSTPVERREIIELGPVAVPALVEYAWSGSGFEWTVAGELLTGLGGAEMVGPLAAVLRKHHNHFRRYTVLITLVTATNFRQIAACLRQAEASDESPDVAEYAGSVLIEAATGK